jgi:hypothetical protein
MAMAQVLNGTRGSVDDPERRLRRGSFVDSPPPVLQLRSRRLYTASTAARVRPATSGRPPRFASSYG